MGKKGEMDMSEELVRKEDRDEQRPGEKKRDNEWRGSGDGGRSNT